MKKLRLKVGSNPKIITNLLTPRFIFFFKNSQKFPHIIIIFYSTSSRTHKIKENSPFRCEEHNKKWLKAYKNWKHQQNSLFDFKAWRKLFSLLQASLIRGADQLCVKRKLQNYKLREGNDASDSNSKTNNFLSISYHFYIH